ncbi:MAG TPA: methyltransferase domain-containing protein [Micropepsaceae bacterium]|jgi:predicted O-methyltransferase YrrM
MKTPAQRKSRFGPPINVEEEMRTGAIAYWQGDYYQSRADRGGVSLLDYIHALFGLLMQKRPKTVLMIGCAGGSLATMLARIGVAVTAIDVNPQAFAIARRYFGLPDSVECRVADGLDYLVSTRRMFDAVALDAFHGGRVDEDLISDVFFARTAKRLRKNGAVFANIHVLDDSDGAADRAAAHMAAAFSDVRILDRRRAKPRNAIVMAGAVRGLKKPALLMPPAIETGKITRVLDAMQFRPPLRSQR